MCYDANKLLESAYHLRLGYIASAVDILAMLLAGHSHPLLGSHLHSLLPLLSKQKKKRSQFDLVSRSQTLTRKAGESVAPRD